MPPGIPCYLTFGIVDQDMEQDGRRFQSDSVFDSQDGLLVRHENSKHQTRARDRADGDTL